MRKENKILYWFIGTFLLPPLSWLISAWYFNVWNTEEMFTILFRFNIPVYVMICASIIFFFVKGKIKNISDYYETPDAESLLKAQKSAWFLPRFFMIILPIYTTLGDFPVLLPLDFIDSTEFMLGISIGAPIVFLFAIPFFIIMNKHLEEFTKDIPFSDKHKPLTMSDKMNILFLLSIIGIAIFYVSGVLGITHNNPPENLAPIFLEKLTVASVVILALTFLNLSLFKKEILFSINQIKQNMYEIAQGKSDLTKRLEIKSRDEIGEMSYWFNRFIENIESIIVKVNKTASSLTNTGDELNSLSDKISQRANEQAATTEEISSSMEQILSTINSNTVKAETTGKSSTISANGMKESNEIFQQTIKSVSEISEKIAIITDIAKRTDILSINAAIEGARTGEVGKGFAVVAQEIKNLANKTKIASDEINALSQTGQEISKKAEETLAQTLPEIIKSAELVNSIVSASHEQQDEVEAINTSIQQLSTITNENSASSEEMAASAEELSSQAAELKKLISVFKVEAKEKVSSAVEPEKQIENPKVQDKKSLTGCEIDLTDKDINDDSDYESF
jgi:methyl-accepting chemotaxis protein